MKGLSFLFIPRRDQGRCDQEGAIDRWCVRCLTRRPWRWGRAVTEEEGFSFNQVETEREGREGFVPHETCKSPTLWYEVSSVSLTESFTSVFPRLSIKRKVPSLGRGVCRKRLGIYTNGLLANDGPRLIENKHLLLLKGLWVAISSLLWVYLNQQTVELKQK